MAWKAPKAGNGKKIWKSKLENGPKQFWAIFWPFLPLSSLGPLPFLFFSISGFWPFSMPYQPGRILTTISSNQCGDCELIRRSIFNTAGSFGTLKDSQGKAEDLHTWPCLSAETLLASTMLCQASGHHWKILVQLGFVERCLLINVSVSWDGKKAMTARDVTGFYAFFSARQSGNFLTHFGAVYLLNCTANLEKKDKNPLEKTQKNSMETAPRKCRFLSLVVVDRALSFFSWPWQTHCKVVGLVGGVRISGPILSVNPLLSKDLEALDERSI